MIAVIWLGIIASVLAFSNLWPRLTLSVCLLCFLSFVTAAQVFSSYQSDGMLLEAGFLALFFAPHGLLPGLGVAKPSSRASLVLLQWEWFRIYFESGLVKLLSGDPEWRNFTAMDDYYQNGPLPTWIGWYVEHLPHSFHAATAASTLALELIIVWMLFLPRRARLICFCIVTPWEVGVILTANYAFLNYIVLGLGFLLLDDECIGWLLPRWIRGLLPVFRREIISEATNSKWNANEATREAVEYASTQKATARFFKGTQLCLSAAILVWIAYATAVELIQIPWPDLPVPTKPILALEPFRIANQYGLFAFMTRGRYEIEFQGSNDGTNWTPYLFRYKPQTLNAPPGIYAPYQPRFEWNLWFASFGDWHQNEIVPLTEERLLENDEDVLALFKGNPFGHSAPRYVRAVLWRYRFTSIAEKRRSGNWWERELLGLYAPVLTQQPDGRIVTTELPDDLPPHD
ncbi:MAG: lipase maturation factor family protein [Terracidiphilus sp.]